MRTTKVKDKDRPTYILSYARWVRWSRTGAVVLLMTAVAVRWILAWVRFLQPLFQAGSGAAPPITGLDQVLAILAAQPLYPLIAAHLRLLLVPAAVALIYAFLPDLSLADDGLAVRTFRGWRVIPWTAVTVVRIASFEASQRRLVVLQARWTRWALWPRLVSLCLGAGFQPGVLFTSAIRDFKPLMLRLYQEVRKAAPDARFDNEFSSPSAALVLEPVPTLSLLVEQAREEGWPLSISAQVMATVPAGLVLVQGLILILEGGAWWKLLAIVGLCELEWLFGALYLYAMAEIFSGSLEFGQAVLLYPPAQIPRALLAVPMALLVAAGAPFLAAMLGLAGVLWAVILTVLLVQQIYRLDSILPAIVGGMFQALFQFLVLAILFG